MYRTIFLLVSLFFLMSFAMPSYAFAGFGVSPGEIFENRLVRNTYLEKTIYLVQGNPDKDLSVKVSVESEDSKDWFSFENGDQFIIPKGIQQYPLNVKIQVPDNVELGIYRAYIRINTVPLEEKVDGQVAISIGGRVDVELTVGNEVIEEFEVLHLDILDIKQNQNPLVEVRIKNTGNVPTAPQAASFELFNRFGDIRLGFVEFSDFKDTPSFSEKSQIAEFPVDIKFAPGEYWGHVKIYDAKGLVIKELKTPFNVYEVTLLDKIIQYIWIPISILLILLIFFIFKRIRKNQKDKITQTQIQGFEKM